MAYVDGIVALAAVDWVAGGLEGLGKPDGFLERQVAALDCASSTATAPATFPSSTSCATGSKRTDPKTSPAAILHGDYSPFNVMVAPDPPARLAAIVDWDTGTIGDPLLDIGHLLARWTEPGEEPVIGAPPGGVDGYPPPRRRWRRATRSAAAVILPRSPITKHSRCSSSA